MPSSLFRRSRCQQAKVSRFDARSSWLHECPLSGTGGSPGGFYRRFPIFNNRKWKALAYRYRRWRVRQAVVCLRESSTQHRAGITCCKKDRHERSTRGTQTRARTPTRQMHCSTSCTRNCTASLDANCIGRGPSGASASRRSCTKPIYRSPEARRGLRRPRTVHGVCSARDERSDHRRCAAATVAEARRAVRDHVAADLARREHRRSELARPDQRRARRARRGRP